jgi:integrase
MEDEIHKEGFVRHNQLGSKYDMDFLLDKTVDFLLRNESIGMPKALSQNKDLEQFKAIVGIMAMTGCRVSECLELKYEDIKLEESEDKKQWITLTLKNLKGSKHNTNEALTIKRVPLLIDDKNKFYKVFIKPILVWYLIVAEWFEMGVWKDSSFKIFKNWSRFRVYYYTYKFLNINPHGFRKIYTTYLVVEQNYPLKVVQKIIGHRDLKNLDYYINLRTEDVKKVISEKESEMEK